MQGVEKFESLLQLQIVHQEEQGQNISLQDCTYHGVIPTFERVVSIWTVHSNQT